MDNVELIKFKKKIFFYTVFMFFIISLVFLTLGYFFSFKAGKESKTDYLGVVSEVFRANVEGKIKSFIYNTDYIASFFNKNYVRLEKNNFIFDDFVYRDKNLINLMLVDFRSLKAVYEYNKNFSGSNDILTKLSDKDILITGQEKDFFIHIKRLISGDVYIVASYRYGFNGINHSAKKYTFDSDFIYGIYYKDGYKLIDIHSDFILPAIDEYSKYRFHDDKYFFISDIMNNGYYSVVVVDKKIISASFYRSFLLMTGVIFLISLFFSLIIKSIYIRYTHKFRKHLNNLDHVINSNNERVTSIYNQLIAEKEMSLFYINIVGVIIISLDNKGIVTLINKKGIEILGYSEMEIIGRSWFDLIDESARDHVREMFFKVINSGSENEEFTVKGYECNIITKSGEKRFVKWVNGCIKEGDNIKGFLASGEDITDRIRLEDEYRQSQKMESVGRLAGGIAHDFNNLLTVIIGNTEIILSELPEDSEIHSDMMSINKAANRAASLTDQLLAFSRKQILKPEIFNLNESVRNIIKMLARLLGEKIIVDTSLDDNLNLIKADRGQMEQVLLNLAVNSRDAMPDGGKIVISTKNIHIDSYYCRYMSDARPGQFVCISFSDTGSGIDENYVKSIFEPFFTTKEMGKGTGLGLSVIYGIVKQHEGWINVKSRIGEGTTFFVYIPAFLGDDSADGGFDSNLGLYYGNGESILFVEDEEDIRKIISALLSRKGYKVSVAANVSEAREIMRASEGKFDVLFSDVILPDGSGTDLAIELTEQNQSLKVILCSGYAGSNDLSSIIESRKWEYVQKPYSLSELLKLLSAVLK